MVVAKWTFNKIVKIDRKMEKMNVQIIKMEEEIVLKLEAEQTSHARQPNPECKHNNIRNKWCIRPKDKLK